MTAFHGRKPNFDALTCGEAKSLTNWYASTLQWYQLDKWPLEFLVFPRGHEEAGQPGLEGYPNPTPNTQRTYVDS